MQETTNKGEIGYKQIIGSISGTIGCFAFSMSICTITLQLTKMLPFNPKGSAALFLLGQVALIFSGVLTREKFSKVFFGFQLYSIMWATFWLPLWAAKIIFENITQGIYWPGIILAFFSTLIAFAMKHWLTRIGLIKKR